jgi:hypothetical protein
MTIEPAREKLQDGRKLAALQEMIRIGIEQARAGRLSKRTVPMIAASLRTAEKVSDQRPR